MASKWLDWEPGAKFQTRTTRGARVPEVPKVEAEGVCGTNEGGSGTFGTCHLPPGTKKAELPWPGYNGGNQFRCDLCGAYFDTSAGIAKHTVYGCKP